MVIISIFWKIAWTLWNSILAITFLSWSWTHLFLILSYFKHFLESYFGKTTILANLLVSGVLTQKMRQKHVFWKYFRNDYTVYHKFVTAKATRLGWLVETEKSSWLGPTAQRPPHFSSRSLRSLRKSMFPHLANDELVLVHQRFDSLVPQAKLSLQLFLAAGHGLFVLRWLLFLFLPSPSFDAQSTFPAPVSLARGPLS